MHIIAPGKPVAETQSPAATRIDARLVRGALLGAILLLAAVMRFWNLNELGYANHYYAAAVKSMLQSWHNFFFVAAEPGGAVSVDKPPLGLWIQAASAWVFGVNSFGLLFPQILAGLLSCWLVYRLAGQAFGSWAGLMAALALAVTPIVVATDRNNTMDSVLILTLLLAAWAFLRATQTARLRWLLLGGLLVGLGFNIKTLAAFLPLPAFVALYFLGAKEGLWPKIWKLALTGLLLLVVSLSWITIVDLVPAGQRPYVGSSGDNSEWSLAIGYNGVNRLLGMRRQGMTGAQVPKNGRFTQDGNGVPNAFGQSNPPQGGFQRQDGRNDGQGNQVQDGGGFQPRQDGGRFAGAPNGGGFPGTGQPGILRLWIAPLSKEMSWLLPFGLFSIGLLLFGSRLSWPLSENHQAVVLWGGWLLTAAVFFSVAGFFHEYYLSILGAPLAVLTAGGAARLWRMGESRPRQAAGLLLLAAAATLTFQALNAAAFTANFVWTPVALAVLVCGAGLLLLGGWMQRRKLALSGAVLALCSLFIIPTAWSFLTAQNASRNQSLPSAYGGTAENRFGRFQDGTADGAPSGLSLNPDLLVFLEKNTQGMKYLMAVPSSMQGADYVLASGRPVLYLGGFNGQDQVLTLEQFQALITQGELRYVYSGGDGRGMFGRAGGNSEITSWVQNQCSVVSGFETETRNAGAPDGAGGGTGPAMGGGTFNMALYDCGS